METEQQIIFREGTRAPQPPETARQTSVFIVDDEPMVGEVVGMVLGIEGFNTRLFTCPLDAIDAFESATEKPDLLITDFVMAGMNGTDLIERCKKVTPGLRAILYSGSIREGESHGQADAMLSKPFLPKELIQTVKAVLAAA